MLGLQRFRSNEAKRNQGFRNTFLLVLTYLITYSMEHRPSWKTKRFSVSQEIPRILWNPKVHCRIHQCPPPVPILSQINPVLAPTSHFLKIHLNIILRLTPGSSNWSLSLRFPHPNPAHTSPLPHTRYILRPLKYVSWNIIILQNSVTALNASDKLKSRLPTYVNMGVRGLILVTEP